MTGSGSNAGKHSGRHHAGRLSAAMSEASGALGDLGTLLPYVITALAIGILAPAPVFAGFAAGYLIVAVVYRIPISVQPMKALGAVIIVGGLTTAEIAWAGTIIGAILIALSLSPRIEQAARLIPQSVVVGLQVGLGLTLGAMAFQLMGQGWIVAAVSAAVLALSYVWRRGPWAVLVVAAAVVVGMVWPGDAPVMPIELAYGPAAISDIILRGVVPQLPLTLLNAVVVAAAVSRSIYGSRAARVSERRLAATSGFINLATVPFGAFPMCHGAGGIAAHHRFGASGIGAPLLLALLCAIAAVAGPQIVDLLAGIPAPVTGALLAYAAVDLAFSRRLVDARPDCRPVMAAAAVVTFFLGAALGLLAGLAAEAVRAHLAKRRRARKPGFS